MRSYTKILVPTDFSINAANAVDFALSLARKNGVEIHLIHSYSVPYNGANVMIDISDVLRQKAEEDMRLLIEEIRYNKDNDDVIVTWSCDYGPASEIVAAKAKEVKADLIVMGTKGADSVASKLLGSVTYNTIKKAKVPVIVVPENAKPNDLKKIIFASDLYLNGQFYLVDYLKNFALDFNSEVDVLYVNNHPEKNPDLKMAIDTLKMDAKLGSVYHKFDVINNSDIEDGINEFVANHSCDLLAVMPKNHGFLESLFHKSITRSLTMHTQIPLLVLR